MLFLLALLKNNLDLNLGDEVVAIFKSNTVLISTDIKLNISARNKFSGTIDSINQGEINSELVIDIGNGDKIASVITTNSIETLNKIKKSYGSFLINKTTFSI